MWVGGSRRGSEGRANIGPSLPSKVALATLIITVMEAAPPQLTTAQLKRLFSADTAVDIVLAASDLQQYNLNEEEAPARLACRFNGVPGHSYVSLFHTSDDFGTKRFGR